MVDGSLGRITHIVAGTLTSVLLGAFVAAAQNPPLAEVARKEEERRKTTKPATKVLTNKDLPTVSSPVPPTPPPDATPVPADADKNKSKEADEKLKSEEKPKPEEKLRDEAWWRARITEPREQLYRDQVLLEALQSRVNGLTRDFVGRDDPYQRARIGEDRQKSIAELERVRAEIADLKKKIDDIEEEARRASVPPGWLR